MSILSLILSALLLGGWALRAAPMKGGIERSSFRLLMGLGLTALVILGAGSVSLEAARWVVGASALVALPVLAREMVTLRRSERSSAARLSLDGVEWFSLAATCLALLFSFVCALAPMTGWDAGVAHLALPAAYVREGRIGLVDGNSYSAYPHLMHCLYTFAFLDGEWAAALVSWLFGVAACGTAYALGERMAGRRCGLIATAVLATAPIFVDQAGTPSLDLAFTATVLAALDALLAWKQEQRPAWLVLAALVAGSGCGIRHTGYLVCALLVLAVLMDGGPQRMRASAWFLGASLAAALPWLLRSAILVGNPFYPFFAAYLSPGAAPDVDAASLLTHTSIQGAGLMDLLLFPFRVVADPLRYGNWTSSPGVLVLVLGVPGLFVGGRDARRLGAFSGAGLACMFFFRRFARYLLPFFAPMAVVAALAVCRAQRLSKVVTAVFVAGCALGLLPGTALMAIRFPAAVGLETRDVYLTRRVERYPAFQWANEHLDPAGVILTLDPRGYYLRGPSFVNFEALKPLVSMTPARRLDWLRAHGIRYVLYPEAYANESPGFRETGVMTVLDAWRADKRHLILIERLDLPRPRSEGKEVVEFYEVHPDSL